MIVLTEKRSDRIGGLRIANPFSGEMEFRLLWKWRFALELISVLGFSVGRSFVVLFPLISRGGIVNP